MTAGWKRGEGLGKPFMPRRRGGQTKKGLATPRIEQKQRKRHKSDSNGWAGFLRKGHPTFVGEGREKPVKVEVEKGDSKHNTTYRNDIEDAKEATTGNCDIVRTRETGINTFKTLKWKRGNKEMEHQC